MSRSSKVSRTFDFFCVFGAILKLTDHYNIILYVFKHECKIRHVPNELLSQDFRRIIILLSLSATFYLYPLLFIAKFTLHTKGCRFVKAKENRELSLYFLHYCNWFRDGEKCGENLTRLYISTIRHQTGNKICLLSSAFLNNLVFFLFFFFPPLFLM